MEFWLFWVVLFGATIGSFLNVCIYRVPLEKSLIWPASHCPKCLQAIRARDNVPILGWIILRGRCRTCQLWISPRYMLVELLTAILFALVFWTQWNKGPISLFVLISTFGLFAALVVATFIDFDFKIIPDGITLPGMILGVIVSTWHPEILLDLIEQPSPAPDMIGLEHWMLLLIGASLWVLGLVWQLRRWTGNPNAIEYTFLAIGLVYLLSQAWALSRPAESDPWTTWFLAHPHIRGFVSSIVGLLVGAGLTWTIRVIGETVFNKEAMGFGDVTLMAMIGSFIGWQAVTIVFFLAPFFGIAISIFQYIRRGNKQIPYGPYLAMATVFLILVGWSRVVQVPFGYVPVGELLNLITLIPAPAFCFFFVPCLLMCLLVNVRRLKIELAQQSDRTRSKTMTGPAHERKSDRDSGSGKKKQKRKKK